MFISHKKGFLQDYLTQLWVRITGNSLKTDKYNWLFGPTGNTKLLGDSYVKEIAQKNKLTIVKNEPNSGLIENFKLICDELPHSKIIDFYEHTTNYHVSINVQWKKFFIPIGWLLKLFFSKRLQQLNLPTSNQAFKKGLESSIIKLKQENKTIWTIWHRQSVEFNEVIFSGIYTFCKTPDNLAKMKVIFPLPNGSATVLFNINSVKNGKFELESNGRKIGQSGFYFIVNNSETHKWVRFVRSMHEKLMVNVDNSNQLYAVHEFKFWKIVFLTLNYKMHLKDQLKSD